MNGNKHPQTRVTAHVHFDKSVIRSGDSDSGGSGRASGSAPGPANAAVAAAAASQKRNSVIRKIMAQTIGENFEHSSLPQMQSFVNSVETYCATTESLASLGKSLYTSASMVFVVDELMRIILWNDYAIKLSGFAREEMAGRNLLADVPFLVPPQTVNILSDALSRCMQGVPFTGAMLEFTKRDRSKLTLLTTCTPLLSNPAGQGMLVIGHDVSQAAAPPVYETPHKSLAGTPAISDHSSLEHQLPPEVLAAAPAPNNNSNVQPQPTAVPSAASGAIAASAQSNASKIPGWSEIAPHYSIECVLGQGSYGQVVRCKHLPTGEIVAIKKIQNVFSDPIDAKRILRELCIVRQLRHPNIVQIREIIAPRDISNFQDLFVVFEYLPSDLEKLLHSPQFLTAEHLRWLLLDLLKALKYMHSAEIVHRDLKPANVLLNLSPVAIKICDFGLARGLSTKFSSGRKRKRNNADGSTPDDRTLEGTGIHPRTPGKRIQRQLTEHVVTRWYRAPEIIFRDHDYSAAIDVWSVGCIFAELLSMQKSSVPSHYQREPLFPGVSCFPLSPGAGQVALPQDSRDQLNTILDVLGTMDEDDIAQIADPDVQTYLRSLPPRPRQSLQEMYPGAEPEAIDLLTWMLRMNPLKRATLDEALSHKYLASIRSLEEEIVAPGTIQLDFDEKRMSVNEIRQRMVNEIRFYHPSVEPAEKREGELTNQTAEKDLRDEQEKERARKLRLKQASEDTQLANLRLKAHREMQEEQGRLEDLKCDGDEKKKQLRNAKRDELQKQKREKAQARKQHMIDLAAQNLVKLEVQQDLRLQNQSQEVRAKEDSELQGRADRRAAERDAIHRSRQRQLEQKTQQKQKEQQSAREMVRQWNEFGQRIELQAKQGEQEERLYSLRIAVEQKQQADARRKTHMEERAAAMFAHTESVDALAKENERFQVVARAALKEAKQRGIDNVFPIKKAVVEKRIDSLPASGFRT